MHSSGPRRAKHNQGFDGPAPVTKVSVNIKMDVQRVRLNLCKGGLGSAYRARVCWLEHGAAHPDTRAVSPASMLVRCSWGSRSAKRRSTLSRKRQRSPAIATTAGVLYARTLTHTRALVAGIREAPDIGDLEARVLLHLYKIAHYELAVDKSDNFA